jgi:hypothetical protein
MESTLWRVIAVGDENAHIRSGPCGRQRRRPSRANGSGTTGRPGRLPAGAAAARARHAEATRLLSMSGRSPSAAERRFPAAGAVRGASRIALFAAAMTRHTWHTDTDRRQKVTYLGEQIGIGREPRLVRPGNSALPLGLDVANVTTADPGVLVENVSARGRRTRCQRVPGSLLHRHLPVTARPRFVFTFAGLPPPRLAASRFTVTFRRLPPGNGYAPRLLR